MVVINSFEYLGVGMVNTPSKKYSILKPGGWLQLIEIYHMIQSDNGTITEDNILRQMSTNHFRCIEDTKDPRAPLRFDSMMRAAGLVELGSKMIPLPLNGWPIGK